MVCRYGALTSKPSSNLLNHEFTIVFVQVIVSSIWTNGARCALNKEFLDLIDGESVYGGGRVNLSPTANVV